MIFLIVLLRSYSRLVFWISQIKLPRNLNGILFFHVSFTSGLNPGMYFIMHQDPCLDIFIYFYRIFCNYVYDAHYEIMCCEVLFKFLPSLIAISLHAYYHEWELNSGTAFVRPCGVELAELWNRAFLTGSLGLLLLGMLLDSMLFYLYIVGCG